MKETFLTKHEGHPIEASLRLSRYLLGGKISIALKNTASHKNYQVTSPLSGLEIEDNCIAVVAGRDQDVIDSLVTNGVIDYAVRNLNHENVNYIIFRITDEAYASLNARTEFIPNAPRNVI